MAAPKNITEQVLEAISLIPFVRTVAEIEVARAHFEYFQRSNLGGRHMPARNFWMRIDNGGAAGTFTMVIAIVWRSP